MPTVCHPSQSPQKLYLDQICTTTPMEMRCIPPRAAFQQATRQSFNNWTVCAKMFVIWQDISTFRGVDWIDRLRSSLVFVTFSHLPPRLSLDLFFFEQYKNNVCLFPHMQKRKLIMSTERLGSNRRSQMYIRIQTKSVNNEIEFGVLPFYFYLYTHTHTQIKERDE